LIGYILTPERKKITAQSASVR